MRPCTGQTSDVTAQLPPAPHQSMRWAVQYILSSPDQAMPAMAWKLLPHACSSWWSPLLSVPWVGQCCCPDIPGGREASHGAHSWPLTSCKVHLQNLSLCLQPTTEESRKVRRQAGTEHKRLLPISCWKPLKRRWVADSSMRSMLEPSVGLSSPGNPEREPCFVPAVTAPASSPPCLYPFYIPCCPRSPIALFLL